MKLNLGCGLDIKPKSKGYINLDIIKNKGVDIVHDLNKFPYPFKDNAFDEVICRNILEHVDNVIKVMGELHRISQPLAKIKIQVPFFSSRDFFTDPTHKHAFSTSSFQYFEENNPLNFYTKARFRIKSKIVFNKLNKILEPFVNLSQKTKNLYENYLAFLLPASCIIFELIVKK